MIFNGLMNLIDPKNDGFVFQIQDSQEVYSRETTETHLARSLENHRKDLLDAKIAAVVWFRFPGEIYVQNTEEDLKMRQALLNCLKEIQLPHSPNPNIGEIYRKIEQIYGGGKILLVLNESHQSIVERILQCLGTDHYRRFICIFSQKFNKYLCNGPTPNPLYLSTVTPVEIEKQPNWQTLFTIVKGSSIQQGGFAQVFKVQQNGDNSEQQRYFYAAKVPLDDYSSKSMMVRAYREVKQMYMVK